MREYDTHSTAVKDLLHKAIPALMWHPDKWRQARLQRCCTLLAGVVDGEGRVLEADKYGVEPAVAGELYRRRVCDELIPKV